MEMCQLRILVIDDSDSMLIYIKESLKSIGCKRIATAKSGKAALQMLRSAALMNDDEYNFHIIICDWMMPDFSGYDMLKEVKSNKDTKDIPFIMLTSVKDGTMVKSAIASGVASYVLKPFTADTLFEKINYIISKKDK